VTVEDKANVFIPLLRCDTASSDCILDVDICDTQFKIISVPWYMWLGVERIVEGDELYLTMK
jgi:hypothetical protein